MPAIVFTISAGDAAPGCVTTSFKDRMPFSRPSASTTGQPPDALRFHRLQRDNRVVFQ